MVKKPKTWRDRLFDLLYNPDRTRMVNDLIGWRGGPRPIELPNLNYDRRRARRTAKHRRVHKQHPWDV